MLGSPLQSSRTETGKLIVWIPAHLGFAGNERADTFAKLGSSESPITAEPHIGLSNRQVTSALNDWALKGTTEAWKKAEECRQARALIGFPSDDKGTSRWLMSKSRWALKTLNRHLHLIGIGESPVCSHC